MEFKLINERSYDSALVQVLVNRGIKVDDMTHFLNTTDDDINSYLQFGEEKLKKALAALLMAVREEKPCVVIVDSDADGYTSAAIIINYLYDLFPTWVESKLTWFIHEGKEHGLSDFKLKNDKPGLIICPDSSSNDYSQHKELADNGWEVIVLDHHQAEKVSEYAIVINNQLSDYKNKFLSGAGVTWQFCKYMDKMTENNYADEYLDLVALGLTADMMSMQSFETKHLINKGFKTHNLKNPFVYGMAKHNRYSLGEGDITYMGAAFYIAPFVNAMVRSGTKPEKQLLFKSMLKFEAFEEVPSTKRGHKAGDIEITYEQAIRVATNVKRRQTKSQDAGMDLIEYLIEKNNMLDNKVLLFLLDEGRLDKNIAGLIANKIMAKYNKPVCILMKGTVDNKPVYTGSARGCDKTDIRDFKGICEKCQGVVFAEGHPGAFGLCLEADKTDIFLKDVNTLLEGVNEAVQYNVDLCYYNDDISADDVLSIGSHPELWGKDVDEPLIAIRNLKLTGNMVTVYEKKTNTVKIHLPSSNLDVMIFKASDEECKKLQTDGFIELNIVGKCATNEWQGFVKPQVIVEDYEIIDSNKYFF